MMATTADDAARGRTGATGAGTALDRIHARGVKEFGRHWLTANITAVNFARRYGIDLRDERMREAVAVLTLQGMYNGRASALAALEVPDGGSK